MTGASGYIGGQLLGRLLEKKLNVRALVRESTTLPERAQVDVVVGDARSKADLQRALSGVETAFYLIHSLGTSASKFEAQDRQAAELFAQTAKECGVLRIIYLSGLGAKGKELSPHLRSRQEVGEILRASGLNVIEFRASIILGNGSASYEIVRALVRKLPVMIAPRWIKSLCQPVFVEDVLSYLISALEKPKLETGVIEIGGKEKARYIDLLRAYAEQTGRMCKIWTVPVLTPWLSSLWLSFVTPVYARIGRALIEGVKNDTVVEDVSALEMFPIRPIGYKEAIRRCIEGEAVEPKRSWMSAISAKGYSLKRQLEGKKLRTHVWEGSIPIQGEGLFEKLLQRSIVQASVYARWLWRVRGAIDTAAGGVGLRNARGKGELQVGDIVDWWRVEKIDPGHAITLLAEMRMPGLARFIVSLEEGRLILKAEFQAAGFLGGLYWWATYPIHLIVFPKMLQRLKQLLEQPSQ